MTNSSDKSLNPTIGDYQILHSLGQGGMGEVFLAFDKVCGRQVALKRIRKDLKVHKTIQERFLREARIASQLTHPSIIPIYSIHAENEKSYYTMSFVEGDTLRQILRLTREQEKNGEPLHSIGGSIPTLIRLFLNVCQAIAYCHSKRIIHRDLKPENIIIGKYGEVLILDWGLAEYIDYPMKDEEVPHDFTNGLTRPGKIVGTVAYMAPERALGESSSISTDIYSLGVMLYQLLTLRLPFQRPTLEQFIKHHKYERLIDPAEAAPYRDIPRHLADIAKKSLNPDKALRYQNVEEMIAELENYIEGRPEWIEAANLDVEKKEDWEFQENILLAKHIAITRSTDLMEWVSLMISKGSFPGNIKMEAKVRFGEQSRGIGFLLCLSEPSVKKGLEDGYCLWVGSMLQPGCQLIRSNVEVMSIPDAAISQDSWHTIRLEKNDNNFRFFQDESLKFNYISHTPIMGGHVGVLYRDADFEIKDLKIFVGSQNVMVNCLSVPDAFLANKDYPKALMEYRRIGQAFLGRAEGREALFRAGITLLEEALSQRSKQKKQMLHLLALDEFGKLRLTPGAPLEYLGKSLVYSAEDDIEEEIKCLELALRKYPKHPLMPILIEHIVFRLHESSLYDRAAAYHFALLSLRHLPHIFTNPNNQKLIESLQKHWEQIPFIQTPKNFSDLSVQNTHIAIQLAFWLSKPITLVEIIENTPPVDEEKRSLINNALFALLKLGCWRFAKDLIESNKDQFKAIGIAILSHEKSVEEAMKAFFAQEFSKITSLELRTILHIFEKALDEGKAAKIIPYFAKLSSYTFSEEEQLQIDITKIWAHLLERHWSKAKDLLDIYPLELVNHETTPLYYLYGCMLYKTEGKKIALIHFSGIAETPYPQTSALLSYFLSGMINWEKGWIKKSFYWEKVQLLRQLVLFYHCAEQAQDGILFKRRLKNEINSVQKNYTPS